MNVPQSNEDLFPRGGLFIVSCSRHKSFFNQQCIKRMPPALHQEGGYIFEGRQAPGRDFVIICFTLSRYEILQLPPQVQKCTFQPWNLNKNWRSQYFSSLRTSLISFCRSTLLIPLKNHTDQEENKAKRFAKQLLSDIIHN